MHHCHLHQQAIKKEVTKLRDNIGAIKTVYEDLVSIVREHFVTLFGSPIECSEVAIEEILPAQTVHISNEGRDSLECRITLEGEFTCIRN